MIKKSFVFAFAAILALIGCNKMESSNPVAATGNEIGIMAVNGQAVGTRGYSMDPNGLFTEAESGTIYDSSPDEVFRTMQISAYQYPKEGEASTYFKGKTFKNPATYPSGKNNPWVNYEDDSHKPIYWPIGSEMDFLAISLTRESRNVDVAWDKENAASKVVLTVPSENTQNDILYASKAGVAPTASGSAVAMQFNHAQAWLEFNLSSNLDEVVTLQSIVLEKVHTAGELTITNNRGNALAEWSFTSGAKDVKVDNIYNEQKISNYYMTHLDMLIPQQPKTAFVIYYTLGEDPQILSYRFTTDKKTWLAGEKYIYNIAINTDEVTVSPTVTTWEPAVIKKTSTVMISYDSELGTVEVEGLDGPIDTRAATVTKVYTTGNWGQVAKLTAIPNDPAAYRFDKWSDGNTKNPRTVTITEDVTYEALFTDAGHTISAAVNQSKKGSNASLGKVNGKENYSEKWAEGATAKLTAAPIEKYQFYKWVDGSNKLISKNQTLEIIVNEENAAKTYKAVFIPEDAIKGEFTVNASGKKVLFSKGNLQATIDVSGAPTGWKFASSQGAFIGETGANKTIGSGAGDIDLFGWSTNGTSNNWGIHTKTESTEGYTTGSFKDWGTNMSDDNTDWRTMTGGDSGEYKYLLDTRSQTNRFAKAKIANPDKEGYSISGLLIFPDGYEFPADFPVGVANGIAEVNNITATWDSITGSISIDNWSKLESAGVVFLPAAGNRNGSTVNDAGIDGRYWSRTTFTGNYEYYLNFYNGNVSPSRNLIRYYGCSVRLVSEL